MNKKLKTLEKFLSKRRAKNKEETTSKRLIQIFSRLSLVL